MASGAFWGALLGVGVQVYSNAVSIMPPVL
jgi:hypothetical protein